MEPTAVSPSNRLPLVVRNVTFAPSDCHTLSEDDVEKARLELNETAELREVCLTDLKQRLERDKNVKYRTDDAYLLRFLRIRKFDCEKAYKTIKDFYEVREKHPEYFALSSNLESLLKLDFFTCLPYADEEGRILYRTDYAKWNPSEVAFEDILRLMIIVTDISTLSPKTQINGVVGIWDVKEMSASHLAQFVYPGRIRAFFKILQGCYPWRMKMIIGVNCGHFSKMFYRIVRPFVKTKIIERVILLGSDMSELHQYVNPALLPKQLGGELEDSDCSNVRQVLNNLDYLKYERSFGSRSSA